MAQYCFGVDVGGTTIKMGLFEADGTVLDKWEIKTRTENNGVNVLPDIAEAVKAKMAEKSIAKEAVAGVGIGVPGPVDSRGLGKMLDMPVKGGNDANVAALGEMWKGGGQGFNSVVVVTLGTGVGGGIIMDGEMLTGAKGAAGEIGHIHVNDQETEVCGCGNKGCLEQYASATGIVRLANRTLAKNNRPTCLKEGRISAKSVWDAVKAGDAVAIDIAEQFGQYLGKGLAGVAGVVNPEAFVIGGGVSNAGEILLEYVRKNYTPYVFHASRDVEFTLATLGNDAGMYGAAKLVLG